MSTDGTSFDSLIDLLAERLARKLRQELDPVHVGKVNVGPRLLSVEQASIYIGRSKEAVQHMIASGKIPIVKSDRRVFIDVLDLDRWIEDSKR